MSEPLNHHYIPIFYLKKWATSEGKLHRYSRLPTNRVVCRLCAPKGTGYEPLLYTLKGYPKEHQQVIEKGLLSAIDRDGALALDNLSQGDWSKLTLESRNAWTTFLMSLQVRTPEMIARLLSEGRQNLLKNLSDKPEEYEAVRSQDDPATLPEWAEAHCPATIENFGKLVFPKLVVHPKIGQAIFGMDWWAIAFPPGTVSLLTSDRPLIMTRALADQRCIISIPLGPRLAFFAARSRLIAEGMLKVRGNALALSLIHI